MQEPDTVAGGEHGGVCEQREYREDTGGAESREVDGNLREQRRTEALDELSEILVERPCIRRPLRRDVEHLIDDFDKTERQCTGNAKYDPEAW